MQLLGRTAPSPASVPNARRAPPNLSRDAMFMSIFEVAKEFGVSPATVRSWVNSGELPCHPGPRGPLVDPDDVEEYLDRVDAGAEADDEDEPDDDDAGDESDDDESETEADTTDASDASDASDDEAEPADDGSSKSGGGLFSFLR